MRFISMITNLATSTLSVKDDFLPKVFAIRRGRFVAAITTQPNQNSQKYVEACLANQNLDIIGYFTISNSVKPGFRRDISSWFITASPIFRLFLINGIYI